MAGFEYAASGEKARPISFRRRGPARFETVFTEAESPPPGGLAPADTSRPEKGDGSRQKRFARDELESLPRVSIAVNARHVVLIIYALLFCAVSAVFGLSLWQARAEYLRLASQEAAARQKLDAAEQRLRDQERILARLRTDPDYVERVIRQQLGYAKPDEFIFRFEP
jgi:cell division protein DivIC